MKSDFDVVVVGSGAGGGVVAGELAQRGRDVLLLECGPHLTARPTSRAGRRRRRTTSGGRSGSRRFRTASCVAFLAGRCVGGTTTINTKVALRAPTSATSPSGTPPRA